MKNYLIILAPLLVAAAPTEPLPDLSPKTMEAIAKYHNCVIEKSIELEGAGETAAETVQVAISSCVAIRNETAVAVMTNYSLSTGEYDAGRAAVIKETNRMINEETLSAAKLAVMTKRANRNK